MMVALAICDTCPPGEIDIIIPVLFNLFDTRRSLIDLLKAVINREIASTGKLSESVVEPVTNAQCRYRY